MKLTKQEKISILKPKLQSIEHTGETTSDNLWKAIGVIASAILMLLEDN